VDLQTVKTTVQDTTTMGWDLATDYLSKAKDIVGEQYNNLVNNPNLAIVGTNLQPTGNMPSLGSQVSPRYPDDDTPSVIIIVPEVTG